MLKMREIPRRFFRTVTGDDVQGFLLRWKLRGSVGLIIPFGELENESENGVFVSRACGVDGKRVGL